MEEALEESGAPAEPAKDYRPKVLEVRGLSVRFATEDGIVSALDRVSFDLREGETLGILGESGSGKTTLALAAMTLLPENATVEGTVGFLGGLVAGPGFSGADAAKLSRRDRKLLTEKLAHVRWKGISMVFQGSMNAFNPVYTIERQIAEVFRLHTDLEGTAIRQKVVQSVRRAGLDPAVLSAYPHELSGGMKQRAVVAMALALEPKLVIADEPTTGLDVVTQARLIAELKELRASVIGSLIVISHDIGVIAQLAERVLVLYAGRTMEYGSAEAIYHRSGNPYTRALIDSYPSLARAREPIRGIPGAPPDPIAPLTGCRFAPRCPYVQAICRTDDPPLVDLGDGHVSACHFAREVADGRATRSATSEDPLPPMDAPAGTLDRPPIVSASALSKFFNLRSTPAGALFSRASARRMVHAVDRVDVEIHPSEILAVVGESGSGKTTFGKTLLKLLDPTAGRIDVRLPAEAPATAAPPPFDASPLKERDARMRRYRRASQMIFQDPYDSLDPNMTVSDIVEEPLIAHREARDPVETANRIRRALIVARLTPPENFLDRYPHELSGGERQRVAAARALVLDPPFLVADEPISMLDVSLRAGFLNLLKTLRHDLGTTIVFVTHDIANARYVGDRILVMYLGVAVELGSSESVVREPLHPYTKALIQAVPLPTPAWNPGTLDIVGEIGNAIDVPKGCRFARRCPYRQEKCMSEPPPRQGSDGHWYLCHFTQKELEEIGPRAPPAAPASPTAS